MSEPTAPRVSLAAVRDFWEAHVNNEYYTTKERGSAAFFDEIERRRYRWHYHLVALFRRLRGGSGRLLEVGCGMGLDAVQLARCGYSVTAVDLTEAGVQLARQYSASRGVEVEFRVGNAERLEFPDASFDAAFSFGVLHHTPDIERAVEELRRVLRPGAPAYVMLYHRRSLVSLVHRALRLPYESPRHLKDHCPVVYVYTRAAARHLFRRWSSVEIHTDYPFTYGFRRLTFWMPAALQLVLGRMFGWHLMIRAVR